ncbi:MAG: DUF362 domain-containing protein [Bacteriovoracaceae bacterium]|nr:DUF362 domain-containing protein [Bacteriovoracaceae bacterium]
MMQVDRRNFVKWALKVFASLSLARFLGNYRLLHAATKNPDLVAVKDGSPAQMFEIGIKAIGGMESFIKKGQSVLVKPNIGWNKSPGQGANTNPDLVGKIVELAYTAGASKVFVFDHTCEQMNECYDSSGIKKAVIKNKGFMLPGDEEGHYKKVDIKGAKILKKALVHKQYLDSDVVINVPILKHHMSTRMTASLKNLMGVVWDRRIFHRKGLHQSIADIALVKKPDLTVIDAYLIMADNGPRGLTSSDLKLKKMQVISTDPVLADTAAAKILGQTPEDIHYLNMAKAHGIGLMDLKKSTIKKISCKV